MKEIKVSFQRKNEKNYMILEEENNPYLEEYKYELDMLRYNKIPGILDLYIEETDGRTILNYDISSMQGLSNFLELRKLKKDDIRAVILGILTVVDTAYEYLIDTGHLIINPDYVYIDTGNLNIKLACMPSDENNFITNFKILVYKIAKFIDKRDDKAVLLSYALQQAVERDNYTIKDIFNILREQESIESIKTWGGRISDEDNFIKKNIKTDEEETGTDKTYIKDLELAEAGNKKTKKTFSFKNIFLRKEDIDKREVDKNKDDFWGEYIKKQKGVNIAAEINTIDNRENEYGEAVHEKTQGIDCHNSVINKETKKYKSEYSMMPTTRGLPNVKDIDEIECEHTVLLTEKKDVAFKILHSLNRNFGDIELTYFPFIVGRQERVCDYVLNSEGVSRLHFKIEKQGDKFIITDLNSRNGVILRGRLLENREQDIINEGDEVEIAGIKYIFK